MTGRWIFFVQIDLSEHDKVQEVVEPIDDDDEVLQACLDLSSMKETPNLNASLRKTVDRVHREGERVPHILFVSRMHAQAIGLL